MKTEVVMVRELFGTEISQKSGSEFISATDLIRAGNQWRTANGLPQITLQGWLSRDGTQEFMRELESVYGVVKISGRGRGHHTWLHPLLFIDLALAIHPKLKIEVYQWLYDHLLKNRRDSGDSFKKMTGALYVNTSNKAQFAGNIAKLSARIKRIVGVSDWQHCTEEQLALRDSIHNSIALLANVLRDNSQAIEYGLKEATK